MNHKLVASILRELQLHGLSTRQKERRNLIAVRTISDLRNNNFTATSAKQLWVTDITEHPARAGRVFCSVALHANFHKAVNWPINQIANAAWVHSELNAAATSRSRIRNTIIHADHWARLTSWAFSRLTCVIIGLNLV